MNIIKSIIKKREEKKKLQHEQNMKMISRIEELQKQNPEAKISYKGELFL